MLKHSRRATAAGTAVFFALAGSLRAQVSPAQEFTTTPGSVWSTSYCCDRTIGWQFEIANPIVVSALGVYDRGAPSHEPGLGSLHEVAIWDLSGALLAMGTAAGTGGTLMNGYRYVAIPPITLPTVPRDDYVVGAYWRSASFDHYPDLFQSGTLPAYHPLVTFVTSEQLMGTFGYPTTGTHNRFLAGAVNFLIDDGPGPGPIGKEYCRALSNSTGFPGETSATGVPLAGGHPLTLMARSLPTNQFGYFLTGQMEGFFNPPMSQGILCLSGAIGRFNRAGEILNTGNTGMFALDVDTNEMPLSPPVPIVAGETWRFQAWHRDLNPSLTSNFSSGLEILFQ